MSATTKEDARYQPPMKTNIGDDTAHVNKMIITSYKFMDKKLKANARSSQPQLPWKFVESTRIDTSDVWRNEGLCASFLAEISGRSPRKYFIFIICKNLFWIKVSKKYFIQFWKRKHWLLYYAMTGKYSNQSVLQQGCKEQCCRFSRNIAQVTPKIMYFYYQKIYLQDQSIQK